MSKQTSCLVTSLACTKLHWMPDFQVFPPTPVLLQLRLRIYSNGPYNDRTEYTQPLVYQ